MLCGSGDLVPGKETDLMHVFALLTLIPVARAAGSRTFECLR